MQCMVGYVVRLKPAYLDLIENLSLQNNNSPKLQSINISKAVF